MVSRGISKLYGRSGNGEIVGGVTILIAALHSCFSIVSKVTHISASLRVRKCKSKLDRREANWLFIDCADKVAG